MEIHLEPYLRDEAPQLAQWAKKVVAKCSKILSFKHARIGIYASCDPRDLEEINGSRGYCPSDTVIDVTVDLNHPNLKFETFRFTLAHQLYSLARRQAGIGIDDTFLECLISEGLADHFYRETYGEIPAWVSELNKTEVTKLLKKATPFLDEQVDDRFFNEWFLQGSEKLKIAKWSGYSLGYALVTQMLKRDKKLNSISFLDVPAKENADITVLLR
jgi:uncharacterized protein YjaZ